MSNPPAHAKGSTRPGGVEARRPPRGGRNGRSPAYGQAGESILHSLKTEETKILKQGAV